MTRRSISTSPATASGSRLSGAHHSDRSGSGTSPAPLVHRTTLTSRRRQPGLRRHRQESSTAPRLRPHQARPHTRIHHDPPDPHPPSRLPPLSRRLLPPLRHGELPRRPVRPTRRRPPHLLADRRSGRTSLRTPRRTSCPMARSPLPLHRQLRRYAPHRNPRPHLNRAGLLRLRPLAARWSPLQPLALAHRNRAGVLNPAAPGARLARRGDRPRHALDDARHA